jgi:hypothetical protein
VHLQTSSRSEELNPEAKSVRRMECDCSETDSNVKQFWTVVKMLLITDKAEAFQEQQELHTEIRCSSSLTRNLRNKGTKPESLPKKFEIFPWKWGNFLGSRSRVQRERNWKNPSGTRIVS